MLIKRLNSSFLPCHFILYKYTLVAHVLAHKTTSDTGIYNVTYQLRMRLLTCTLCCQILQQLAEIGVSGVAVGKALQQLSQHTEVRLHNVTVKEIRMHTHRYVLYKVLFCMLNLA